MLGRMQKKGNSLTLLVGMQTGAATLENSMDVPQILKRETPYNLAIALLNIYPKDTKIPIQRGTCTPMFIAALAVIAKLWKETKYPSTNGWIKMWYIYNGILLIHQKE